MRRALFATIAALVSGCSGPVSSPPVSVSQTPIPAQSSLQQAQSAVIAPVQSSSFADPDAASTGSVIISSGGGFGSVYVYSNTLKLVAQIASLQYPQGLALDLSGNLYVANSSSKSPGIFVYESDYKTLRATLSDPYPSLGVAVDSTGVVAATNIDSKPNYVGSVTFFASGSTTPCATLTFPNLLEVFQGAFDSVGNLYVTGETANSQQIVGVIRGGCSANGISVLSTTNSFSGNIYGIQITRFGKIAVLDQGNSAIYTYNPPVNGALGTPISTTPLIAPSHGFYQFAFTEKGAFAFVVQQPNLAFKYAYPKGGNALQSFGAKQLDEPVGLVLTPVAQP